MANQLTVVVPCYNEVKRIGGFFELIEKNQELDWEWLFVDDGSSDSTAAKVQEFAEKVSCNVRIHSLPKNQGKGAAVCAGLIEATGDLVGYVDADLAASPITFKRLVDDEKLRAGGRLIVGIRLMTHDGKVERLLHRHLMGRVFQTITSNLTGLRVYDTQCGFKLMSRELARRLGEEMWCKGFCFDVELIMRADSMGVHIEEVPISWVEKGHSTIRFKHIFTMFRDVFRIRDRVRKEYADR
jgi:glycosyltransferase involved in cell wall biosynthesis